RTRGRAVPRGDPPRPGVCGGTRGPRREPRRPRSGEGSHGRVGAGGRARAEGPAAPPTARARLPEDRGLGGGRRAGPRPARASAEGARERLSSRSSLPAPFGVVLARAQGDGSAIGPLLPGAGTHVPRARPNG